MMDIKILIKKEKYICHTYTMIYRNMRKYFAILFFTYFIFSFSVDAQPNVIAIVKNATCAGKNDGNIELQVSGNGPFKFKWNNGSGLENLSKLAPGDYEVAVTDKFGKVTLNKSEIKSVTNLTIKILLDSKDLTIEINGGLSPYSYTVSNISNLNQITNITSFSNTFKNLSSGTYAIVVKDSNGCVIADGVEIN